MGFTPLEGLVMGTRSGDLDPAILDFVVGEGGLTLREVDTMLNKQSGLLGVSGLTADMRELLAEEAENGDRRARLAIDMFCYRVQKYLGAYLAAMNGADAIVFAGGIGENSPRCARAHLRGARLARHRARCRRRTRRSRATEGRIDARRLARRAVGDPDRRGAAHRARHVARGDGRGCAVLRGRGCAEVRGCEGPEVGGPEVRGSEGPEVRGSETPDARRTRLERAYPGIRDSTGTRTLYLYPWGCPGLVDT